MVTLGRAGIGAEEVKRSPAGKHHRIAFQLHFHFFGEVDDVLFKDVGLCLTGGKENLVTSGKQGVNQGFTGKVKGRADWRDFSRLRMRLVFPASHQWRW